MAEFQSPPLRGSFEQLRGFITLYWTLFRFNPHRCGGHSNAPTCTPCLRSSRLTHCGATLCSDQSPGAAHRIVKDTPSPAGERSGGAETLDWALKATPTPDPASVTHERARPVIVEEIRVRLCSESVNNDLTRRRISRGTETDRSPRRPTTPWQSSTRLILSRPQAASITSPMGPHRYRFQEGSVPRLLVTGIVCVSNR